MTANPFDFFDRIVCINLDSRPDRWALACEEFDNVGIRHRVQRLPAITGNNDNKKNLILSVLTAIRDAEESGLDNLLIFEDDVIFKNYDPGFLQCSIDTLRKVDWNLFYLGGNLEISRKFLFQLDPIQIISRWLWKLDMWVTTAHAIAYNSKIFNFMLSNPFLDYSFENAELTINGVYTHMENIDDLLATHVPRKFCVSELMCFQRKGLSDLTHEVVDWGHACEVSFAQCKEFLKNKYGLTIPEEYQEKWTLPEVSQESGAPPTLDK